MIDKKETIAATMAAFMESGPKVAEFPKYKSLNDYVGKIHGLAAGKCQALAGESAWAWYADTVTGTWRPATPAEVEVKRTAAANKVHGTRGPKAMPEADRSALNAQVTALEQVANPALAPLLEDLRAKQAADDAARKGTLKNRLQAVVEKLGLEKAVEILEARIAEPVED